MKLPHVSLALVFTILGVGAALKFAADGNLGSAMQSAAKYVTDGYGGNL